MSTRVKDISTEVARVIGDASLPIAVTVQRAYRPQRDLKDMPAPTAAPYVAVIPASIASERLHRAGAIHDVAIDVVVSRRVDVSSAAAVDAMVGLVESIIDLLTDTNLDGMPGSRVSVVADPLVDANFLNESGLFMSTITATYQAS